MYIKRRTKKRVVSGAILIISGSNDITLPFTWKAVSGVLYITRGRSVPAWLRYHC